MAMSNQILCSIIGRLLHITGDTRIRGARVMTVYYKIWHPIKLHTFLLIFRNIAQKYHSICIMLGNILQKCSLSFSLPLLDNTMLYPSSAPFATIAFKISM